MSDTLLNSSASMEREANFVSSMQTSVVTGTPDERQWFSLRPAAAAVAALGLLFQVGHFAEHFSQFGVWILGDLSNICGRDTPWMSPWAYALVAQAGQLLFPAADAPRQIVLGMEVL